MQRALIAEGITAEGVTDGARGLAMTLTGAYELVLLDLLMPGMEGDAVLALLAHQRPDQPVVIVSALTDVETKIRCFGLGAVDYLAKPFALEQLLERVHARLRPNGSHRSLHLQAGGIRLDLRRHAADVGGRSVPLSGREFLLLRHLMGRAGDVCSPREILADVWCCSFDPGTNVVETYVRRLRSKLGRATIESVPNGGYRVPA